jgi:hypothetical protein
MKYLAYFIHLKRHVAKCKVNTSYDDDYNEKGPLPLDNTHKFSTSHDFEFVGGILTWHCEIMDTKFDFLVWRFWCVGLPSSLVSFSSLIWLVCMVMFLLWHSSKSTPLSSISLDTSIDF